MPTQINKTSDSFSLTENEVNIAVAEFFKSKKANVLRVAIDREQGYDVHAELNHHSFIVESKGSKRNDQSDTTVFDSGQLKVHLSAQIFYFMKQLEFKREKTLLIMANPDIPRIRKLVNEVSSTLNKMALIRFWVDSERKITIECPIELEDVLSSLELL